MGLIDDVVHDIVERTDADLDAVQKEKLEEIALKIFEDGLLPKEAMGLTDQTIEAMYAHAYRLYQGAKYGEAGHIFRMLSTLNPEEPKYYLGMGACLHRMKDYQTASFMYDLSAELDKENPMPLYYSSDCRINLGHTEMAIDCLKRVIERAAKNPQYALISDRARLTLKTLQKELVEEVKSKKKVVKKKKG